MFLFLEVRPRFIHSIKCVANDKLCYGIFKLAYDDAKAGDIIAQSK